MIWFKLFFVSASLLIDVSEATHALRGYGLSEPSHRGLRPAKGGRTAVTKKPKPPGKKTKTPKVTPKNKKRSNPVSPIDSGICALLGAPPCTEPVSGFFNALANAGSFSSPSLDAEAFKRWIKDDLWRSLSMDNVVAGVPEDDHLVSTENQSPNDTTSKLLLDEFLGFLLSGGKLSTFDFVALKKGLGVNFNSRRLGEEAVRVLKPTDDECRRVLTKNVMDALILCLAAIGIDQAIGQKLVGPLVEAHNDAMVPLFETQFVHQGGLTAGFLASAFIVFWTNISWSEVEEIVRREFTGVQRAYALMQIAIDLMGLYASAGWTAVAKFTAIMPSLLGVFNNDIVFLNDQCFGATVVNGCADFQQSGGQGLTTSTVNMGQTSGNVKLFYDMYGVPDEIEVFYEGNRIYWSGGQVSGSHQIDLSFGPGKSQLVVIRISATISGTAWEFSLSCPQNPSPIVQKDISYTSLQTVMEQKGLDFWHGAYNLNLVGIRNTTRTVGKYDDTFCVLYEDEQGNKQMAKFEKFTADPGPYYMQEKLLRAEGCAIVVPGQYKLVWQIGLHRGLYTALVQTGGNIKVYRDKNRDLVLDMDPSTVQTGMFGINLHHGDETSEVGRASAGCQVFQHAADLNAVLELAQKQISHGHGSSFSYTLLDEADLGVIPFDPFLQRVMFFLDIISYPFQDCALGYLEGVDPGVYQVFVCEYLNKASGCSDVMDLVTASNQYSEMQFQNDALDKLQRQIESTHPNEWNQFKAYWRKDNECPVQRFHSVHMLLTDVMAYFDPVKYPFQKCAVDYLESLIDKDVLLTFQCEYRNLAPPGCTVFTMAEAAGKYTGLDYQNQALNKLQAQIEFSKRSKWFQLIDYWRQWGSPCPSNDWIFQGVPCQSSSAFGLCLDEDICSRYGGTSPTVGLCLGQQVNIKCCFGLPPDHVKYGINNQFCTRYRTDDPRMTTSTDNNHQIIQLLPIKQEDLTVP